MNMNEELLTEWELSKDKPTKRFKELLGIIAKDRFDKYTKYHINIVFEYWVKDYIIQGAIKNRNKFNPERGVIVPYFTILSDGYALNITDKLIKGELKSSES